MKKGGHIAALPSPSRSMWLDAGDFGHQHEQADGHEEQQDSRGDLGDGDRHCAPAGLVLGIHEGLDHAENQEAYEQADGTVDDEFS